MPEFSHVDNNGRACMVTISDKIVQHRYAKASGKILLTPTTLAKIKENQIKKGDVLTVAQIAGIQAAKQTANLIPLCHPLMLEKIAVNFSFEANGISVISEVQCTGKTGVEMEALTAASVALLTIYDMCKAIDKTMQIDAVKLVAKIKT